MFSKLKHWLKENKLEIYISILAGIMLFIISIPSMIVTIEAGHEGVIWYRFFGGTSLKKVYTEGTKFIFPWDKMHVYNMRLKEVSTNYQTLSKNGLNVGVEVTFRFRPKPVNLPKLHKFIGPDYIEVLILPKIGSHVREVLAHYEPEALYSTHRQEIERKLLQNIRNDVLPEGTKTTESEIDRMMQYIVFENVFITKIALPERVIQAIEAKESTKQKAMAYDHRLDIARKEKMRKRIEAEGVRDFQNTINEGISDKYLIWKGIEATLELASSPNSKVVVIGSGDDGLPIILGGDYSSTIRDLRQERKDSEEKPTQQDPKSDQSVAIKTQ
ncbi:prohibitin family protein [Algicola sagamiensis]|uniref:prohibitin family protein n=1 Tax=Algicola sagamiensis TaxID=163869 RepID=UPI00037737C3|nr:prohibitin family protein [Algicola sagamiensis]